MTTENEKKGLAKISDKYHKIGDKKKWKPWMKHGAKAGIDLASVGMGTGGAFLAGIASPLIAPIAGILLMAFARPLGDSTGVLRVCGASMFGYGLAKINQPQEPELPIDGFAGFAEKAKERLGTFKNEWMKAFFIDKVVGTSSGSAIDGFGAIDTSALDAIKQTVEQSAINYEMDQIDNEEMNSADAIQIAPSPNNQLFPEETYHPLPEEEEVIDFSTL